MKLRAVHAVVLALAALCPAIAVRAQDVSVLRATVEAALAGSPEISARMHALDAAGEDEVAARAARGPRVDMTGDLGHERASLGAGQAATDLERASLGLRLTQVLWDGLGAKRELQRTSHERQARYFELLETSEQVALEALRALYDVQRHRRLVTLAEGSVTQHRLAAQKMQTRVGAGVARGVDLEQANARLALAESNLATERSNLHDVEARYLRVVGVRPSPGEAQWPVLMTEGVPATAAEALRAGVARSPAVRARIETVHAARSALQLQSAGLQPRVELQVRSDVGRNVNGLEDRRSDADVSVLMSWNLFDGGAGRARVRQRASLLGETMDLRDQACRDVRQTLSIAYNDAQRLADQVVLLEQNTLAIDRARDAYRQQFDIGQRSLLDVLNAENEAHTAQRALANARFDFALAHVRVHAGMSQLNAQLGIAGSAFSDQADHPWGEGSDNAERCPD